MENQELLLITEAQRGDERALNRLFSQWYPRIYNLALRYFGDEEGASEVCQQTFLTVHRRLGQLQEPASFRAWLYRTAINCCHEEGRRRKRRINALDQLRRFWRRGEVQPTPYEYYRKEEDARLLLAALQKIPEEQREVILMKAFEGLKFREIASILDLSENTVKSRLYYGLSALRKLLTHYQVEKEMHHE